MAWCRLIFLLTHSVFILLNVKIMTVNICVGIYMKVNILRSEMCS